MANYTTNKINLGGKTGGGNVSASGATTDMIITPNPGFVVRASDFTAVEDPNIGTINVGTPVDVTSAYAIGNTVKIPITLTDYVMPSADTKLQVDITGNAVLYSSLTQTVPISFTINNNLTTGAASGVTITSAAGANSVTPSSGTPGANDVVFSGNATFNDGDEQVQVGTVVLTVDETGTVAGVSVTFSNSNTSNNVSSLDGGVSIGDLVTGTGVPAGTFVTAITDVGGGNSTITLNNTLNGTISLTFTQDQVFDDNPLVDVVEIANEITSSTPKEVIVVPTETTTNSDGYARSVTLNLFVNTKKPIHKSDNLRLDLTGKSSSIVRTNKIKAVTFGSTTIHPDGETRTIKVYGDVGAKFNMTLKDNAGSPADVFTALSDEVIPAGTSSSKGQGIYTKEFTIPQGVNASANNGFTPPFKLEIDAGTNTIKDNAIVSGTPDYTLNQYAYPKLTITTSGSSNHNTPAAKVVIGRPNTPASQLNYLKSSGDTIDIEYVLTATSSNTFAIDDKAYIQTSNITNYSALVATIANGSNSIVLSADSAGVANKICTIKFTLQVGTWGTTDTTYTVKLNDLVTSSSS